MRIELTGRHVPITPALRRLVDEKLGKLERLLNDSAVSAQAVLSREKYRLRAEITLHARGEKFLHGVGQSTTWEPSLTQAIEKITQQAQKVKSKWHERKRQRVRVGAAVAALEPPAPEARPATAARQPRARVRMPRIFRASRQAIKPMSVADAAREVEASGDGLVVFQDPGRASVSVLYRRQNGELTLVETES
jgi:putative sigma-54 modulation protein